MAEPHPDNDDDSQLTVAGCLLLLVSLAVIGGVALPVVTWRDAHSGRPAPRIVAIVVPVLAGALCHGIGTAILRMIGMSVFVKAKKNSPNRREDVDASEGDEQTRG
jgi:hypothetical protein